jgi:branched-subunit amino acid aminotransferase/4-amino-4-deoxychorismate lyase
MSRAHQAAYSFGQGVDSQGARAQSLCSPYAQYVITHLTFECRLTDNNHDTLALSTQPLVGTQRAIGVGPPNEALLFVILSPVGPYYPNGFKPVSLYGTTEFVRAAPGGTRSRVFNDLFSI